MHIPSFFIIGISIKTSNENQQAAQDIPALWQRFMSEGLAAKIPNKISEDLYCIYTDYEKDYTRPYTTVLGCKVSSLDQIPEGMTGYLIPEATYQLFTAKGKLADQIVFHKWSEIWNSGMERKYTADFEVYGAAAQNPEAAVVDIYLSIP
ncbi:GyrI-like domain-containing protein [Taibaiella sp. KBW10]|uniref:GyrI-like domain-containing protein n=1 Tax=Taibaiella sp. KBW10 TaxID=2153357 RepID=UPI0018F60E44|nr:GyrI-like domain-containing protein [Taibaiella sp. KBW10]